MHLLPINKKSFCHLNIWHLMMVIMLKWKILFLSNKKFLMMTSVISTNLNCFSPFLGAKYLGVFSSRSLKTGEKYISFAQFVYCEFYHSKLKSKHTSLIKYTNWAKLIHFSLVLKEREEKKTNISHLGDSFEICLSFSQDCIFLEYDETQYDEWDFNKK